MQHVYFKIISASATISEQNIVDYSKEKKIIIKKSFAYQPIKCRFGRFGTSSGIYVNRTLIKCITPKIEDVFNIDYIRILIFLLKMLV